MLLRFLVQLMLVAARAVLLPLDALRMEPLVLRGEVIPILTLAAGEDDLISWHFNYWRKGLRNVVDYYRSVLTEKRSRRETERVWRSDLVVRRPPSTRLTRELTTGIE